MMRRPPIAIAVGCLLVGACGSGGDTRSAESKNQAERTGERRPAAPEPRVPTKAGSAAEGGTNSAREAVELQPDPVPVPSGPEEVRFRVGGDIERPRRLAGPLLNDALSEMMRSGEYAWGACIFTVTLSERGEVGAIEFLKPEELAPEVRSAITDTVRGWRFSPATRAGEAVPVYHTLVINHCPHRKIR